MDYMPVSHSFPWAEKYPPPPPPHTLSVQQYPQLLTKIQAFYTQHGRSTQVQNNNIQKLIPVLVELQPKQGEDNTVSPFYRSEAEEQAD